MASSCTPEQFADILVSDLGLGGEFKSIVAHSIREQVTKARRDGEIDTTFAIEQPFRSEEEARGWCPHIHTGMAEPEQDSADLDRHTRYNFNNVRAARRELRNKETRRRAPIYKELPNPTPATNVDLPPNWRCLHCKCTSAKTDRAKDGPRGENSLCNACGMDLLIVGAYYQVQKELPEHRLNMFMFS